MAKGLRLRIVLLAGLALLVASAGVARSAVAQSEPPFVGDGHGSVDASGSTTSTGGQVVVGSSGPGEPGVGAGADPCVYWVGDRSEVGGYLQGIGVPGAPAGGGDGGASEVGEDGEAPVDEPRFVVVRCESSFGGGPIIEIFELGDPPPTAGMLEAAQRALRIPLPEATFSPAAEDFQVVGIETWVWMDADDTVPLTATACIPPGTYACATVVAVFDTVDADMGDGSDLLDCDGPGLAYDPDVGWEAQLDADNCGHVYIEPSDAAGYPVTVASVWSLTWSCVYDADLDGVAESSCGGGPVGAVRRVAAPVPLEVREYQAVATIGG